jgi:sterol desaturase/sphingolipid hydroxylase (fatty acid hydroxylase superfamily)
MEHQIIAADWWVVFLDQLKVTYPWFTDRLIFAVFTWVIYLSVFWSENIFLYLCYCFKLFPSCVIQPGLAPPEELVKKNLKELAIAHLVTLPISCYFFYDLFVYFGTKVHAPIPSWSIIFRDLFVALAIVDAVGYWGHRIVHHKSLYKFVHKKHHEYKVSVGIASVYATPWEDIFVAMLSSLLGCLLMGSHVVVIWVWLSIRMFEAVYSHSGYHFLPYWISQFLSSGEFHEYHHSHNIGNYGAFTIFWDWLMGTDVSFNGYMRKKLSQEKNT